MLIPFYHVRPPVRCESLRAVTARAQGSWETAADAHTVQHRSDEFPEPLQRFFAPHSAIEFAPTGVATIPGGRVFGEGIVTSPCGTAVARDVSIVFGGPYDDHWLTRVKKIRRPARVRGTVLAVASAGARNYYHWLLDELPRLLLVEDRRADYLVATQSTPFARGASPFLNRPEPQLQITGYSHYRCDQLVVPTYLGNSGQPSADCVHRLTRFGDRVLRGLNPSQTPEKVYLSRSSAARRRTVNETELMTALDGRGFQRVELESVPWVNQVALFRRARVVVAPHGAGLANLVFATPGCRVVEYFHPRYMHWCFWQIASLKHLEYHPVVADEGNELQHRMEDCGRDIVADVPAICRALDRA